MQVPSYRHHKARNLAVVRFDGRDVYLGPYDSPESHQKYRLVVAEWLAQKPAAQPAEDGSCTVNEIVLRFLDTHKNYYTRQDGTLSPLLVNIYMRRFVHGWKSLGHERRLNASIVNYADYLVICCRGTADEAMTAMRAIMNKLKLTVKEAQTRLRPGPEGTVAFPGYTIGRGFL